MEHLLIHGARRLRGRLKVRGAKNAALPLMAACLLTDEALHLGNVPELADIRSMEALLRRLGVAVSRNAGQMTLRAPRVDGRDSPGGIPPCAPYSLVRRMRASVLVLGPLLARFGEARVSLPGGCAIGVRGVDFHLDALRALGARVELRDGYINARAPSRGLCGGSVVLPYPSVGATANTLMAMTLARGTSELVNAAREPEIDDLARALAAMGARITRDGQAVLRVSGVAALKGTRHRVMADRIEAGSYALAVAACGGSLRAEGVDPSLLSSLWRVLEEKNAGVSVALRGDGFTLESPGRACRGLEMATAPYPGFPTDLQAQLMAFACLGRGVSTLTETVFENRFLHVAELRRMGAEITLKGRSARVRARDSLSGAEVMATDLRASMGLVIAALAARGTSVVRRVYHLDRGYARLEESLTALGADLTRVP